MMLNATFNNISAILWQSVLLMEEPYVCLPMCHGYHSVTIFEWATFVAILMFEYRKHNIEVGTYISDYMYNSGSLKKEKQQKTNKQTNKTN
jgi:hypothetical protein